VVGGRMISFAGEGATAARLMLRILQGEKPEQLSLAPPRAGSYLFDWRQLRRWNIPEAQLPADSVVRYRQPGFWDVYRWHILAVLSLCVLEAGLIVGLLVQRASRRRAEAQLRDSHRELRALTGRLLQAQETERRRIARELHDDLNQGLALLAVELDLLGQKQPEPARPLRDRLHELSGRIKQLSSSVHNLSHLLHPSKLEQLGLVAALRSLCKELTQAHGLPIDYAAPTMPISLSEDVALCLYRIAQEALGNVVKHSSARQARVELEVTADAISLRIVDDGNGFDPGAAAAQEGLGLASMRERLRPLGGRLTIDSRALVGTRVLVQVPLARPAEADDGKPPASLQEPRAGI
jgi:signal transduction histidine kinase